MSKGIARLLALGFTAAALPALLNAQTKAEAPGKWTGYIGQLANGLGQAELRVEDRNAKESRATLNIRNSHHMKLMWWDIVEGQCGTDGPRIAAQAKFTPITTLSDGSAQVSANVPRLDSEKRYYVRVYESGAQPSDQAAWGCVNIVAKP